MEKILELISSGRIIILRPFSTQNLNADSRDRSNKSDANFREGKWCGANPTWASLQVVTADRVSHLQTPRARPPSNQYLVASRYIDIRSGGGCILYRIYVFRYM